MKTLSLKEKLLVLLALVGASLLMHFATGCSLYTQQSPLPSAADMKADCAKAPGSLSCDVYPILVGLCNGQIAIPITSGNIDQAVCVGLGYRTVAGSSLLIEK